MSWCNDILNNTGLIEDVKLLVILASITPTHVAARIRYSWFESHLRPDDDGSGSVNDKPVQAGFSHHNITAVLFTVVFFPTRSLPVRLKSRLLLLCTFILHSMCAERYNIIRHHTLSIDVVNADTDDNHGENDASDRSHHGCASAVYLLCRPARRIYTQTITAFYNTL